MAELTRRLKSVGAPAPVAVAPQAVAQLPAAQAPVQQPRAPRGSGGPMRWKDWSRSSPFHSSRAAPQRPAADAAAAARLPQPAKAADPGVRIGPFRPDPSLIAARQPELEAEHARANEAARAAAAQHFIPPAAERPDSMQPRMPRVEDFPPVAQRQLRAQQAPRAPRRSAGRAGCWHGLRAGLPGATIRSTNRTSGASRRSSRASSSRSRRLHPTPAPAAEFAKPPQPRRMGEGQARHRQPRPARPAAADRSELGTITLKFQRFCAASRADAGETDRSCPARSICAGHFAAALSRAPRHA